jgi:hypothetical protein
MSTPGFEPYLTLWQFFYHGSLIGQPAILSEDARKDIEHIVGVVTEHRLHPYGSTLIDRFTKMMSERNGIELSAHQNDLVGGLLKCLDAYQSIEPYTNPGNIRLGIYDHFKGGVYKVKGFSTWESGNREKVVEYDSMIFGTSHTRFAWQWCEVVRWPDEVYRSRWVYRGSDLRVAAPPFKVSSPS